MKNVGVTKCVVCSKATYNVQRWVAIEQSKERRKAPDTTNRRTPCNDACCKASNGVEQRTMPMGLTTYKLDGNDGFR